MNTFRWPDGVRCAVLVSIHFDAESFDLRHTTEDRLYGRFSYGRYGVRAGLPRLLAMLQRRAIPATWFITGEDARRHPEAVKEIYDAGHEIGARGWDLTPLSTLGDQEYDAIRRGCDLLADICGTTPQGFRASAGELSSRTLEFLVKQGLRYDSSFQDDDHPYLIAPSPGTVLAEVPTVWSLDDSLALSARHTHARLMKIWREECEALERENCMLPLTIHLRGDVGMTRAARINALEDLLSHLGQQPGVRFMTGAQIAAHTLASGVTPEPNPLTLHQHTLSLTPYRGDMAVKPL
jgi:peptidoglycan/xylan/chitin deacetylase (PgdA/CDA1 family)